MTQSRWEYSKARSAYHFDPTINEDDNIPFSLFGRVEGADLAKEFWDLYIKTETEPNTFSNRLSSQKISESTPFTLGMDLHDLSSVGAKEEPVLFDNMPFDGSEVFTTLANSFGLDNPRGTIHIQRPLQMFPYHIDELPGLKKNNPNHWLDETPEKVRRFEIQLLDWVPGHIWAYGNSYWKQWKSGDIGSHEWRHLPHGTANISLKLRATLQVTGWVTEKTEELIKNGLIIKL